ncbi:hypothetical protein Prudu_021549 [Prunus dulcis]|uniref:Ankyrin repeat family protein n=1 Tax=Prunus dulcis TaxID=3755 RepID=A0A4Y1RZ91_PRUDU|nr:hypothetical protein Prudu_021549 [Prunus dulcis]
MSDLIRHRRAPTSAATAPSLMDHLTIGPVGSQAPASSASSGAQPVSARRRHRPASTTDTTSTDASGSQPAKKNTRGPCRQLKRAKVTRVTNSRINIKYDEPHWAALTAELHSSLAHDIGHSWNVMPDEIKMEVRGQLSTNYNLEDLDDESLAYVNRLFSERYKQWKSDLHHYFEAFDDPQVALQEGCPKEFEGREDSWAWLCAHFQAPAFVNKAKVNKGNRKKKTLLHHSGSRPFSYRMDARWGVQIPRDRHGDGGEEPVGSSGVRLPTSSRYSDRVCGSSIKCWVSDLDRDVGSYSQEEAGDILSRDGECQAEGTQTPFISVVKQSGDCFDSTGGHSSESDVGHSAVSHTVRHSNTAFDAPTSEPVHPEHPHQTTAHVDPRLPSRMCQTTM